MLMQVSLAERLLSTRMVDGVLTVVAHSLERTQLKSIGQQLTMLDMSLSQSLQTSLPTELWSKFHTRLVLLTLCLYTLILTNLP